MYCDCAMCIFTIICRFLLILFTDFISFEWGCGYHESEGAASDGPIWQPGAAGSQHNNHSSRPPWSWSGTCTVLCCAVLYCTVLYCTVLCCTHPRRGGCRAWSWRGRCWSGTCTGPRHSAPRRGCAGSTRCARRATLRSGGSWVGEA